MTYVTPEARLLAAGWPCPNPDLERVIMRREALRSAIALLRPKAVTGADPIGAAILAGDPEATAAAIERHLLGTWLDDQLQRPEGFVYEWSAALETELRRCVFRNVEAVLSSLEGIEGDASLLRRIAAVALEGQGRVMGTSGRWILPEPEPAGWLEAAIPRY